MNVVYIFEHHQSWPLPSNTLKLEGLSIEQRTAIMALLPALPIPLSIIPAVGLFFYVVIFVGRRGRNFPDGKSILSYRRQQ